MLSNITKIFTLNEEMKIISSDDPEKIISFKSGKSLSLNMDYLKQPIDWFIAAIDEWISRIEINREKFTTHTIPSRDNTHGGVEIRFNGKTLVNLILEKSHSINNEGKKCLRASIQLRRLKLDDEILDTSQPQTIYFNDITFCSTKTHEGKILSFIEALEDIIPTRSETKVKTICYMLKILPEEIIFDSYQKRYIITSSYLSNNWIRPPHPKRFYKYISMSVYFNMLKNHSFRMNSIVAQSDESESLYFGNYLCNEYENEIDRFKGILNESNILISCFTDKKDNSYMWEKYGDNGEGIMLEFESTQDDILTPIQYINEDSNEFKSLKENILLLIQGDTRLHFTEIDAMHRFIKNDKFKDEKEWRLIHEFKGELDSALYGNTLAYFHDFPFAKNLLPELNLSLISVTLGPKQRKSNIAQLIKASKKQFGNIDVRYKIDEETL